MNKVATTIGAITIALSAGFFSNAHASEESDAIDRQTQQMQWNAYVQDSERYREQTNAAQRQQERDNACYLSGERSAMCRAYGDPYRAQHDDRRYRY